MLSPRSPLRVAILCSHRAPGLVHVLNRDCNRGRLYEIVCCISSESTFAEEVRVERRGIPTAPHPIQRFYEVRGAPLRDLETRREYDARMVRKVAPYRPDLVLLSGYLYLLTEPMLDAFAGRILNIHHADLLARRPDGAPRYPGLHAVRDAILAGESETRVSSHVVTTELDAGPLVARSWPFPVPAVARWATVRQASDILRAVAFAQTEWMMRSAWGPIIARSIESVAHGTEHEPVELMDDGTLQPLAVESAVQELAS
jgi:folate-dependent phosphoribosylglycinamide formyltransferase PurN